ncbi:MAG: hypothetical protein WDO74_21690 [Pseudomonadota bacterium]
MEYLAGRWSMATHFTVLLLLSACSSDPKTSDPPPPPPPEPGTATLLGSVKALTGASVTEAKISVGDSLVEATRAAGSCCRICQLVSACW